MKARAAGRGSAGPRSARTTCGPWSLLEPLGRGASATVWRARHADGREGAVKLLDRPDSAVARRQFAVEVTALGRIEHPLAPRLLWVGDDAFATELVHGRPLSQLSPRPITRQRLLPLLLDLLDVLAHVHALDLVHRDLKPDNLLIESVPATSCGQVVERLRVVDFGLASASSAAAFGQRELVGTLAYMAPEQRAGEVVDRRADLYAVGVIAAEFLGRASPVLDRLLAVSPGLRPATADDAIALLLDEGDEPSRSIVRPPRDLSLAVALRYALSTARVPESLRFRVPDRRLASFLTNERRAGRLRRAGGRWVYDAPVSSGDDLYRDGRMDEAIDAYLREGAVLRAVDLLVRRQEYDRALRLLEDSIGSGARLPAEAQLVRGHLLFAQRDHGAALTAFRTISRRSATELRAAAACGEGAALLRLGHEEEARASFLASLALARTASRPALESKALANLGLLAVRSGQLGGAHDLFRDAISSARAGGDPAAATVALLNLGVVCEEQHQLDRAVAAYEDGIEAASRMGNRTFQCAGLLNVANVNARRLDLGAARDQYGRALALAREIGDCEREGLVLVNLANLQTLVGRFAEAVTSATAAIQRLEGTAQQAYLALAYRNRADAMLRSALLNPATLGAVERDFSSAQDCARRAGAGAVLTEVELDLAGLEAARGLLRQAATRASRALSEAKTGGHCDHEIRAHVVLAAIFNRGGLHERALAEAQEAEAQIVAAGIVLHRLDALLEGAWALERLGQGAQAESTRSVIARARAALSDAYAR